MVTGEWSLPVLISTLEPCVMFPLPGPDEEGSDRAALVGTWHLSRPNQNTDPKMKPENLGCSSPALLEGCVLSFARLRGFLMLSSSLKRNNLRALLGLVRRFFEEEGV